jgi:hypothetical protein
MSSPRSFASQKKVLDKGGVTVVEGDDTIITAYNVNTPVHRPSGGPSHV